jgi:large subunit GTPase 1
LRRYNKADLLSPELRQAWADYFDERGIEYLWWSAKSATEEVEEEAGAYTRPLLSST